VQPLRLDRRQRAEDVALPAFRLFDGALRQAHDPVETGDQRRTVMAETVERAGRAISPSSVRRLTMRVSMRLAKSSRLANGCVAARSTM
jgi:hypothetical protein